MNSPAFRPIGNRYLVFPDPIEEESETIGEVTLSTPKDPHKQSVEGTVVAKGKSCTELEIGDKVVYGKYSGYDHALDGTDYKVLQENELLGEHLVTPFDPDVCQRCGGRRLDATNEAEPCGLHRGPRAFAIGQPEGIECAFCHEAATTVTQTCKLHEP